MEATVVPIRTSPSDSMVIALAEALSSIPVLVNPVRVPTDVIDGCAAVVTAVSYTHLTLPTICSV